MLTKQYQTGVCELLAKMIARLFSWKFLLCLHCVFALLLCPPVLGWTLATSNVSLLSVPNKLLLLCPDKNNMFAGRMCSFAACFGHVVAGLQKTFLYGALDMQPAGARHAVHLLRATFRACHCPPCRSCSCCEPAFSRQEFHKPQTCYCIIHCIILFASTYRHL